MLWPILIISSDAEGQEPSVTFDAESPYIFSITIANNFSKMHKGIYYDFLIEGLETKHYLQITFKSGTFCSLDGLAICKEQVISYNSAYSNVGTELLKLPVFTIVPLPRGEAPALSNSTITQTTHLSITRYADAVVFSFDEFNIAKWFELSNELNVAVAENGALAAIIFREGFAENILKKIDGFS